jgi:SAM-dependent methyltransferase
VKQSDIFWQSEGDRWLLRNHAELGKRDPVSDMIAKLGLKPEHVLEIGCSNGWRLEFLRDKYGCKVMGIDPSQKAADEAAIKRSLPVFSATAAALPIRTNAYDMLIYGFCLYLTDPVDWFVIVMEGDRVLKGGGYLIIHDFMSPPQPYARQYEHCDGVRAYHVDFAQFWLASPLYELVHWEVDHDHDEGVTVLRKRRLDEIEVLP